MPWIPYNRPEGRGSASPFPLVADFNFHILRIAANGDAGRTAAGVTVNVGEALLYDPEYCGLLVER